jgi:hypothetical protein
VRFNERSLVVLIGAGLVVAIAVAVGLFVALGGDDDPTGGSDGGPAAVAGNAAAAREGGPDEILYLSGTALLRRDIASGDEEPLGTLESPSVYPARGSQWIAYVTTRSAKGDDDFAAEPQLRLYDPETEDDAAYGAGVAPVWNPTGTHVAFLRPVEPRNCQGETCSGDVRIGVVEAATGEEAVLPLDPGLYSILGWAGGWVVVGDFEDPATVTAVPLDGDPVELDMPASQYWAASPDGRWIVKTNAKKTELVPFADGALGDDRVAVELGDYQLLEGAWAHDSSAVAAVVSIESKVPRGKGDEERLVKQGATTRVVTFTPDDPEPQTVAGTFGATGSVLWSVDNDALVFATLLDPKRALFQAKYCELGNGSGCTIVTSWTEGVTLLRTE